MIFSRAEWRSFYLSKLYHRGKELWRVKKIKTLGLRPSPKNPARGRSPLDPVIKERFLFFRRRRKNKKTLFIRRVPRDCVPWRVWAEPKVLFFSREFKN
jgi:hypothetical protein